MTDQANGQFQAMKGTAILAACIVQTLGESDPSFQRRFLDRMDRAYREVRKEGEPDPLHAMELLAWVRELLTGFSVTDGQRKPFLAKD